MLVYKVHNKKNGKVYIGLTTQSLEVYLKDKESKL